MLHEYREQISVLKQENAHFAKIFDFEKYQIQQYSGNVLNKKELLELSSNQKTLEDFKKMKLSLKSILNNEIIIDCERAKEYIDKIKTSKPLFFIRSI